MQNAHALICDFCKKPITDDTFQQPHRHDCPNNQPLSDGPVECDCDLTVHVKCNEIMMMYTAIGNRWQWKTCDACGELFTPSEWDKRETPHDPDCPNYDPDDEDEFVECTCDRNYHADCFNWNHDPEAEADETTVTIDHLGYWRKQIARIRELAEDPNPSADEERAEIEAEMAAVFMQLIGE
jgi:hypothetical protein